MLPPRRNSLVHLLLPVPLLVSTVFFATNIAAAQSKAPTSPPSGKHLLIIGEEKGYRHESVSHAMSTL